ncbi:type II toxin-antitoxin system HipA family toxin [Aquimarina sp. BL5]|uniref:type II toxin-antitoxin system HipA family toxin n=1 Tax=Aquimarina sp. BL5 TaxID=1714860 RepID=UPI000E495422|nr:type II toxin-antitoxin system HipA family toxin [Aquimarina sp. BL5]AXT49628.1 type II toxin-antitoxin system HipA family toxin [Aquimarina sp. BL5]RKN05423.1 type II toxin-antitoxin system HipA family toxin [Aquimarina sp. BL5]
MVDVIKITLWGQELGALSWDADKKYASFEFFPDFLRNNWDVSPIHMPILNSEKRIYSFPRINEDTYKGLPGMLSDVLPDDFGNRLIDQWLLLNNIPKAQFTPLDRLCYIGTRGMGALEFQPARNIGKKISSTVEIDKLVTLAQKVLNSREKIALNISETEHLNELIKVGTSAGGQRAKAIIAFNSTTNEIRSGQTDVPDGFEHYLFKFDGVNDISLGDPQGYGRIEYAYYLMALDCGIDMEHSQLFEEHDRAHFMTKRFDRLPNNEKLHMQTLCSLAHFDYKSPGAYSYENAFEIMRQLRLPHQDAIQLYKRMLLNVIARNQDDHTKNISFLMNKQGIWKLAPAYDITYSYNPTGIWTSMHQMSINGKRDDFRLSDLLEVGDKISYKNSKAEIQQILEVVNNWNHYANKAGIPPEQAAKLQKAFRIRL